MTEATNEVARKAAFPSRVVAEMGGHFTIENPWGLRICVMRFVKTLPKLKPMRLVR